MTDQSPGHPAGRFFRIPVTVQATAYVRAASPDDARRRLYDAFLEDPVNGGVKTGQGAAQKSASLAW